MKRRGAGYGIRHGTCDTLRHVNAFVSVCVLRVDVVGDKYIR